MSGRPADDPRATPPGDPGASPPIPAAGEAGADAPCRRFTLGDAMILVAASACGLAYARIGMQGIAHFAKLARSPDSSASDTTFAIIVLILFPLRAFLFSWTPAFLLMRLRRPRPPFRRMALQPGVVACEALLVTSVIGSWLHPRVLPGPSPGVALALAIPFAWSTLGVLGLLRPERGWIDRLGRVLGVCWVVQIGLEAGLGLWITGSTPWARPSMFR